MFAVAVTETCSYVVLVSGYSDHYDRMLCSYERMLFGVRICILRMHDERGGVSVFRLASADMPQLMQ